MIWSLIAAINFAIVLASVARINKTVKQLMGPPVPLDYFIVRPPKPTPTKPHRICVYCGSEKTTTRCEGCGA